MDVGHCPPMSEWETQKKEIANSNVSSDNQAGKDVRSTKSGSRSTQAGSRK